MTFGVETYRKKRMAAVEPYIAGLSVEPCDIAVCIPALDELEYLPATIDSIAEAWNFYVLCKNAGQNKENVQTAIIQPRNFRRLLIVVNVNNRKSAGEQVKASNRLLFEKLCNSPLAKNAANSRPSGQNKFTNSIKLAAINSFSTGRELPEKDGAGFARKIALDYGFLCCNDRSDAILCCLDADTLIDTNYFIAIAQTFGDAVKNGKLVQKIKAGVTGFTHQPGQTAEQNAAIAAYEEYLKSHSCSLKNCGSAWWPVALGPTLVCTAQFYGACGGMNRHTAGEDFYFLQALLKSCRNGEFAEIPCMVHPAARFSNRVAFGTGTAIKAQIEQTKPVQGFLPGSYEELKTLLTFAENFCTAAGQNPGKKAEDFLSELLPVSAKSHAFLQQEQFEKVWPNLFAQNRKNSKNLMWAFNCWFDGLKTIRFFHFLENGF